MSTPSVGAGEPRDLGGADAPEAATAAETEKASVDAPAPAASEAPAGAAPRSAESEWGSRRFSGDDLREKLAGWRDGGVAAFAAASFALASPAGGAGPVGAAPAAAAPHAAPPLVSIEKGGAVARAGDEGEGVKDIQDALNREGAARPPLDASGRFDARTEAAVRAYQASHGLAADGRVGPETLGRLLPNADQVAGDPRVARLDPAVRREVADGLRKAGDDYRARGRLLEVATAPGFEKLAPAQERQMLAALDKSPGNRSLAADLRTLAGSESFRRLDPSVQALGLDQIAKHTGDVDSARATLVKLESTPGLAKLDAGDAKQLLQQVGGANRFVSEPSRAALADRIETFAPGGDPDAQARVLKDFLHDQPQKDWHTPAGEWDGHTTLPDDVSGPLAVGPGSFDSAPTQSAEKYVFRWGTKEIPIIVPPGTPGSKITQIKEAMAALPKESRDVIRQVIVEPAQDPSAPTDAFHTNGDTGTVHAFPSGLGMSPFARQQSALVHETGHIFDRLNGRNLGQPAWNDAWRAAAEADQTKPSAEYGATNDAEDFSEAYLLYQISKGRPEEAEYRAIFPNRFRLIDEMLAKQRAGTL
jgi:peptidoglycan hydrolase-like protein with peptidoglycan-binding domain